MSCPNKDAHIEKMNIVGKLIAQRPSDECGCPEEEWEFGAFNVILHLEPFLGGDIFIDCGDWEDDKRVECNSIEELREKAAEWAFSFPVLDI